MQLRARIRHLPASSGHETPADGARFEVRQGDFNVSPRSLDDEPKPCSTRLTSNAVQLSACLRVVIPPQQRIAVVGSGNIDVGSTTPTRGPDQPVADGSEMRIDPSVKTKRQEKALEHPASVCGAMSQQGNEFRGNVSAPQKFVRLVGCRDRKVGPGLEARQYSNPVKR
jgi:hypothetical protein